MQPNNSFVSRAVYSSIWLPFFFLCVFALFILAQFVRLPSFIHLQHNVLLANNICFLLVIALRFIRYASRLRVNIRYGSHGRPSAPQGTSSLAAPRICETLAGAGFSFEGSGYGEKSYRAWLGMSLLYGGLLVALTVGTYDNLRQFSGVFFQGEGAPLPLDDEGIYFDVAKGPWVSYKGLPRLKVKKLIYPSPQMPGGGAQVALLDKNFAVIKEALITDTSAPLTFGDYEYRFGRTLCDVIFDITNAKYIEYSDSLKLFPGAKYEGKYTHFGRFKGERLYWFVRYDPLRKAFNLLGRTKQEKKAEGEIVFRRDDKVTMGDYTASIGGFSEWAEVHVIRHRHTVLIFLGALVALAGVLLRLLFAPQRVWVEDAPEGSRLFAVGSEAKRVVAQLGESN